MAALLLLVKVHPKIVSVTRGLAAILILRERTGKRVTCPEEAA
jgi:hypothetical protein